MLYCPWRTKYSVMELIPMATATAPKVNADGTPVADKVKTPSIMVTVPADLKDLIQKRGEAENKPNSRIVLECTASYFGYDLPPMERARRSDGGTGVSAKNKNQAITMLVELAKAGQIELTPELKELLGV